MDDYSIWQDLFDTIQSFPDWLKLVAVLFLPLLALIPPALILILTRQYFAYGLSRAAADYAAIAATQPPRNLRSSRPAAAPPCRSPLSSPRRQGPRQ